MNAVHIPRAIARNSARMLTTAAAHLQHLAGREPGDLTNGIVRHSFEAAQALQRATDAGPTNPESLTGYYVVVTGQGAELGAYRAESAYQAMRAASRETGAVLSKLVAHKITPRAPETGPGACLRYALCLLRIATADDWLAMNKADRHDLLREVERLKDTRDDTHNIMVSCDHEDGQRFVEWLQEQGHTARLGATTGSFVNGYRTTEPEAQQVMTELWEAYCADNAQDRLPSVYVYDNGQELIEFVADKDGYYCWAAHLQQRLAEFESLDDMRAAYRRVCALPTGTSGMAGINQALEAMTSEEGA